MFGRKKETPAPEWFTENLHDIVDLRSTVIKFARQDILYRNGGHHELSLIGSRKIDDGIVPIVVNIKWGGTYVNSSSMQSDEPFAEFSIVDAKLTIQKGQTHHFITNFVSSADRVLATVWCSMKMKCDFRQYVSTLQTFADAVRDQNREVLFQSWNARLFHHDDIKWAVLRDGGSLGNIPIEGVALSIESS